MFTEKSTFLDLSLFLAEHDLRCTRLQAPRGEAPAVAILQTQASGYPGSSAQGSGPTAADALNDAARVLRSWGVIS